MKCIQKGLYVFPDEITHLNKYTCLINILGYIEDIIMLSKGFILCKSFIISPKQKFLDRHEYYFTWSPGFQLIFKRTRTSEASKMSPRRQDATFDVDVRGDIKISRKHLEVEAPSWFNELMANEEAPRSCKRSGTLFKSLLFWLAGEVSWLAVEVLSPCQK